jgi:hypothetical protein
VSPIGRQVWPPSALRSDWSEITTSTDADAAPITAQQPNWKGVPARKAAPASVELTVTP